MPFGLKPHCGSATSASEDPHLRQRRSKRGQPVSTLVAEKAVLEPEPSVPQPGNRSSQRPAAARRAPERGEHRMGIRLTGPNQPSRSAMSTPEQAVTPELIQQHQRELNACLGEVEEAAKKAKEASAQALDVAGKCREETKRMIAEFQAKAS